MKKIKKIFLRVFSFGLSRCLPIEEAIRIAGDPQSKIAATYMLENTDNKKTIVLKNSYFEV